MRINKAILVCLQLVAVLQPLKAQTALDYIERNRNFAASNYSIYPDTLIPPQTPPPAGYQPFYLSHYGRHGSRYINSTTAFDIPRQMLLKADSLGQLTETGKCVLKELEYIIEDTNDRWGDLTGWGKLQHRGIARRMVANFPELFRDGTHVDARSTTVTRCILSMGVALQTLENANPRLYVTLRASQRDMHYMNFQDKKLRKGAMTPEAQKAYDDFCADLDRNPRIMRQLFVSPDSVRQFVDERWLNYYIIKAGMIQQNTHLATKTYLLDLFTAEELYRMWKTENVWWFINHGFTPLNGSRQPYTQRHLLRQLINDADSCIRMVRPPVQLRYGHETVLLPLVCLLGINGFDFTTDRLEELEPHGWLAALVFPMASNLQFVFYRRDLSDRDILFKVLLNEREATLPLPADKAPYYHWNDFREHYLNMLDADRRRKK